MKAVLLEQNIFAPITPVSVLIIEMLAAIQFNCYVCICVEQVNFPESGIASVVANGESTLEIGMIGGEGMTGVSVVLGADERAA